ncbi:MAG TPA: hypothetical protein VGO40_24325, partial [Longimicrobium sp.]|nr:hypothetical protein [Longimicrobium sp.]
PTVVAPSRRIQNETGEFDFIVSKFFSADSLFALFVALLFPIAVIGAAFVFSNRNGSELSTPSSTSFDLTRAIEVGTRLPPGSHQQFARSLQPSIVAYFTAKRSSQDLAIATSIFHLENEREISNVEESLVLREEIRTSALESGAKDTLMMVFEEIARATVHHPQEEVSNDGARSQVPDN